MPTIYRYQGRWWHGGFKAFPEETAWSLLKELAWLLRHGEWCAGWEGSQLIFGFGRMWYDGPHWHLNVGVASISLSAN